MTEETSQATDNPLIIIGDKIAPKPYLIALMQQLRVENSLLPTERQIRYAVCTDNVEVAVALKKHLDAVKMVLIGPGLLGNAITVARMLASKNHIVIVVDPSINPLGPDPATYQRTQKNLEELGVIVVLAQSANDDFFEPLVNDYVLSGLAAGMDLESMTAEERAEMVDKRLDAVNKFPSLPDTQRRVAELDDLDSPKKWAEAIEPDLPTCTVIFKLLNSARYGLRSRVAAIDQAVILASARTIREIVIACQIRQVFQKTSEDTIDQFWRHSLATAYFAKLFCLPANPADQSSQQKTEFERFQLEDEQVQLLQRERLWEKFELSEKDDAFTSGLLHDIGKVAMLMCLEDSLELVLALVNAEVDEQRNQSKLWAPSLIGIERFLTKDMDHQVIGGRLADRWELEPGIQQVISHHHDIHERSPDLLKLVALANLASSTLFPYPVTDKQHPFPQLFERIEKAIKKKAGKNLPEAIEEAISTDIFEDLVDVLGRMDVSSHLWEIVDFKSFFKICYLLAPKIRSTAISFLQQTG